MNKTVLAVATVAGLLTGAAHAQGLIGGAQQGVAQGNAAAGPVGGIVGGAFGAATGTVGGVLGGDPLGMGTGMGMGMGMGMMGGPDLRSYIMAESIPSYSYGGPVRVGTYLPRRGITYYVTPAMYGTPLNYTVVNGMAVLTEPHTHRVVQVLG